VEGSHSPMSNATLKNVSQISAEELQVIKNVCEKDQVMCLNQSDAAIHRRSVVKEIRLAILKRNIAFRLNPHLAEKTVEDTMTLIYKAKKAYLRRFGIPKDLMKPANDGLFFGDVLLANEMTNEILRTSFAEVPGLAAEKDFRSSISTDQHLSLLWQMPIPYFISKNISSSTADMIDDVIAKIQNQTCIRFAKRSKVFDYEIASVLMFEKFPSMAGELWCALATFGHVSSSFVYVNENCSSLEGHVSHALLHVLGLGHEFTRLDRTAKVFWEKIHPQYYDVFALDDKFLKTSFGLPFDVSSIMNRLTIGGKNPSDEAVTTNIPQTKISCGDFENLKKMYCCPGCLDLQPMCGYLANVGFCQAKQNWFWMKQNCAKSCGHCCQSKCSAECQQFCKTN